MLRLFFTGNNIETKLRLGYQADLCRDQMDSYNGCFSIGAGKVENSRIPFAISGSTQYPCDHTLGIYLMSVPKHKRASPVDEAPI